MSTSDPRASFVQLSALLTGFSADVIAPAIDPIDLPTTYLGTAQTHTGNVLGALLATYDRLAGGTAVKDMTAAQRHAIGQAILGLGGHTQAPEVVGLAQAIMKLWYLGSWYQPFDYTAPDGTAVTTDLLFGVVVSADAYTQGLSWKAMQSHAMGNSTWTFGYWASPPAASLSDFTGNPTPA